jgi:hypothetical protein
VKTAFLIALLLKADLKGAYVARTVAVDVPDAGTVTVVADGGITGCWLDTGTCVERARERLELQERVKLAEAAQVKKDTDDAKLPLLLGFGVGAAVGAAIGVVVGRLLSPTQPSP